MATATDFGSVDAAAVFEAPPRRGRPPKAKPPIGRGGTSGKPSLKQPIGGMLVMLNLPVQMFMPADALDAAELEALAMALDEQCKVSPQLRRYVEAMLGLGTGSQLLVVVGMIAGRRAARHGLLGDMGETTDRVLGDQLASMTNETASMPSYAKPEPEPPPPPEPPGGWRGMPAAGAPAA